MKSGFRYVRELTNEASDLLIGSYLELRAPNDATRKRNSQPTSRFISDEV